MEIPHITESSLISKLNSDTHVTAPYQLLSDTTYTSDMNAYAYENYTLTIINKENPNKLLLHVLKNEHGDVFETHAPINHTLPYWSKCAPKILKELDFSKVDGKEKEYRVGTDYRLTMLDEQGAWGKVYILEHVFEGTPPKIICAVKVLLTRIDENEVMTVQDFRERHEQEIDSNMKLIDLELDIAIKTYGIVENDPDHYLLFLEYGESARDRLKSESEDTAIDHIDAFMKRMDKFHADGYAHGDLKLENVLFVNNAIKVCDWFSFNAFTKESVGTYRYFGDNLPPEAMRALYYRDNNVLFYTQVSVDSREEIYFLHPIAADRFCLAISLLEIVAPDLYRQFKQLIYQGFNPYTPESLDFWEKHRVCLKEIQQTLVSRSENRISLKKRDLFLKIAKYIDTDPLKRTYLQS